MSFRLIDNLPFSSIHCKRPSYNSSTSFLSSDFYFETVDSIGVLEGHRGCINCLAFNSNGSLLASGSDDGTVRLWNLENKKCLACLYGHVTNVFATEFFPHRPSFEVFSFLFFFFQIFSFNLIYLFLFVFHLFLKCTYIFCYFNFFIFIFYFCFCLAFEWRQ
jgi:WD40 repeat protein